MVCPTNKGWHELETIMKLPNKLWVPVAAAIAAVLVAGDYMQGMTWFLRLSILMLIGIITSYLVYFLLGVNKKHR